MKTIVLDARHNGRRRHASVRFLRTTRSGRTIQQEVIGDPQSPRLLALLLTAINQGVHIVREEY